MSDDEFYDIQDIALIGISLEEILEYYRTLSLQ